jgi:undecaprenyl pyrophosphate phosphatase UppP
VLSLLISAEKIGIFLLSLHLQLFGVFMRINKKKIGITLGVILVLLASTLATFYYFRDEILKVTLEKVAVKMERDFDSKFTIKTASFDGISAVRFTAVSYTHLRAHETG